MQLPDEAIEVMAQHALDPISPETAIVVIPGGGAPSRVDEEATAFGRYVCARAAEFRSQALLGCRPDHIPKVIAETNRCEGLMLPFFDPVRLSLRGNYVKFTDEMEQALSPQRHLDKLNAPLVVAYGTFETPEFQRQSRDFAAAVKAAGKPVELIVGDNYCHTELLETLCNPYGLLGAAILELMGLRGS